MCHIQLPGSQYQNLIVTVRRASQTVTRIALQTIVSHKIFKMWWYDSVTP